LIYVMTGTSQSSSPEMPLSEFQHVGASHHQFNYSQQGSRPRHGPFSSTSSTSSSSYQGSIMAPEARAERYDVVPRGYGSPFETPPPSMPVFSPLSTTPGSSTGSEGCGRGAASAAPPFTVELEYRSKRPKTSKKSHKSRVR
jgi:hypothetical protein